MDPIESIEGSRDMADTTVHLEVDRSDYSRTRIVVCSAGRGTIEETHWGLTPAEREQVFWDISWIWGPPEDELATLFRTIGPGRFVYGTAWPLRLAQTPRSSLALLPDEWSNVVLADPSMWE